MNVEMFILKFLKPSSPRWLLASRDVAPPMPRMRPRFFGYHFVEGMVWAHYWWLLSIGETHIWITQIANIQKKSKAEKYPNF